MKAKRGRTGVVSALPCNRCGKMWQLHYRRAETPDGIDDYCCECRIATSMASRRRDPETYERYKAKQREWYFKRKLELILGKDHPECRV